VDYLNAGTAEFLRDEKGNFYFIEVNSRLQVEHPVTELVTGIDLVKLQIRIASGEDIPFKQSDLTLNGSAIECRINAEDPLHDFVPSVGLVPDCNLPYGPGVRVDTYLYPRCNVSGYYDSLVAKLITWGQDFNEARVRMSSALDEFMIEGISTTIPLYRTIMNEKNFIEGNISTDYLEKYDLLNLMRTQLKEKSLKASDASVAAALLYSEFLKAQNTASNSSKELSLSNWVRSGNFKNGIQN
jgi:acetyl-CoA/propionyl-CoA carboxylase